jgi:excisionase family DNA binding protein
VDARTIRRSPEPLLSVPEVAKILGVSTTQIRRLVDRGDFPIVQISARRYGVRPQTLRDFIDAREGARGP